MREELKAIIENWQMESGAARKMSVENLKKFNHYLAMEVKELYHNSRCIFLVSNEDIQLFEKRIALTDGKVAIVGELSLDEYDQRIILISCSDHPFLGTLLRRKEDEKEVLDGDVIDISGTETS